MVFVELGENHDSQHERNEYTVFGVFCVGSQTIGQHVEVERQRKSARAHKMRHTHRAAHGTFVGRLQLSSHEAQLLPRHYDEHGRCGDSDAHEIHDIARRRRVAAQVGTVKREIKHCSEYDGCKVEGIDARLVSISHLNNFDCRASTALLRQWCLT